MENRTGFSYCGGVGGRADNVRQGRRNSVRRRWPLSASRIRDAMSSGSPGRRRTSSGAPSPTSRPSGSPSQWAGSTAHAPRARQAAQPIAPLREAAEQVEQALGRLASMYAEGALLEGEYRAARELQLKRLQKAEKKLERAIARADRLQFLGTKGGSHGRKVLPTMRGAGGARCAALSQLRGRPGSCGPGPGSELGEARQLLAAP